MKRTFASFHALSLIVLLSTCYSQLEFQTNAREIFRGDAGTELASAHAEIDPPRVAKQHLGEFVMTGTLTSMRNCSTSGIVAFSFELQEQYLAELVASCCHFLVNPPERWITLYDVQGIARALGLSRGQIRRIKNRTITGLSVENATLGIHVTMVYDGRSVRGFFDMREVISAGRPMLTWWDRHEAEMIFERMVVGGFAMLWLTGLGYLGFKTWKRLPKDNTN